MTRRFGFTLAEVLITLTIIGVIAAMTIPTLLSNTSDQEYKTGLKKAISTINQAITMQYALEGTNMTDYTERTGANMFNNDGVIGAVFRQRMQVVNTTTARNITAANNKTTGNAAIYLSDGMVIEFPGTALNPATSGSTGCRNVNNAYDAANRPDGCLYTIVVDVNGDKGKCNVATETAIAAGSKLRPKDCFPLDVYADGVRPANFVGREIMYSGK